MKNIIKKIQKVLVFFAIVALSFGPMTVFATDLIHIDALNGKGTWKGGNDLQNLRTFEGTTNYSNGSYDGKWWTADLDSGTWKGVANNGKISGNITGIIRSGVSGTWIGSDVKINPINTLPITEVIGDTFATLNGNYLKSSFDQVYFKYGQYLPFIYTTLPRPAGVETIGSIALTPFSEKIANLKPRPDDATQSIYQYQFCGTKSGKETCGNIYSFGTAKTGESYFSWNNLNKTGDTNTEEGGEDTSYKFLAPLSNDFTSFSFNVECAFADYANKFIKIFIGICGVLAMVMIISGGIQYMTSELVSSEVHAKDVIQNALLGLILAVAGYAILNTLNPKLLELCIDKNLPNANVVIGDFDIPSDITFDGKPIKVNFNKQAYPAAEFASEATQNNGQPNTGVETSLILAIFSQETGSGRNVGRCNINHPEANMYPEDKVALAEITKNLNKDLNSTPVSCSLKKPNGQFDGHGGAIGLTQFRPVTWLENAKEGERLLGHTPDPWNPHDAIMMTAIYIKKMGGAGTDQNKQKESACKYFGGPGVSCSKNAGINKYGTEVMGKKLYIEEQIRKAKAKGEI